MNHSLPNPRRAPSWLAKSAAHFDDSVPALAVLEGRSWVVHRCPLCGTAHRHGAGGPGSDPRSFLGARVAHCSRGSYELVEASGAVPPRVAARYPAAMTALERAGVLAYDPQSDLFVAPRREARR